MSEKKEKVVLAYSGGLDTSIIIPWLKEHYGDDVIAMSADVGQGEELAPLKEKAIKTGAAKLYIEAKCWEATTPCRCSVFVLRVCMFVCFGFFVFVLLLLLLLLFLEGGGSRQGFSLYSWLTWNLPCGPS